MFQCTQTVPIEIVNNDVILTVIFLPTPTLREYHPNVHHFSSTVLPVKSENRRIYRKTDATKAKVM